MLQTIIVYHRQPFEEQVSDSGERQFKPHRSPNGIIPSLRAFVRSLDDPQSALWLAWSAVSPEDTGCLLEPIELEGEPGDPGLRVQRVGLSEDQVRSFYHVTSKAALWPILHSFPGRFDYDAADWETFRSVNQIFSDAVAEVADVGATVWVHDYNLWLVPGLLRARRPDLKIAFFLHTAFPAADVFGVLPWREEIAHSLLSCDRIGFHTARYAENFALAAESFCRAEPVRRASVRPELRQVGSVLHQPKVTQVLHYQNRLVHLDVAPIGIDTGLIKRLVQRPEFSRRLEEIREIFKDQRLIVSIGRVDYTKGTVEMLDCYDRYLAKNPDAHGKVKLCLASVAPAKGMDTYADIQQDIEQRVGGINGRYTRLGWIPITLFTRSIPYADLLAYYRAADLCWITPLRDGLNLVCKEYVAAKQGEPGVLVLSDFAGAVVELDEAVHVNPYSSRSMDRALAEALAMSPDDARQAMQAMSRQVHRNDIRAWTRQMMRLLA